MKYSSSLLLLISLLISFLSSNSAAGGRKEIEWGILTKMNFTSQIRAHNHILLLVTVPWCGESRSIAKELSHTVAYREKEFGYLKLMVLYRNSDKFLANAIGASEGVSLFYFHRTTPYRYNGRLRSQNILSSVYNFMLLHDEEIPLKPLKTLHDIENLFQSTDKAVILVEFCGWSRKLLQRRNYEVSERAKSFENQSEAVGLNEENLSRDAEDITSESTENQKILDSKSEELAHGIKNGYIDSPSFSGYMWANHSNDADMSCTAELFQKFKIFFSEFLKIAREHFLPFEKHRFGLISDRSMLLYLNVGNINTWSTVLHLSGFDKSIVVSEGVDLRAILRTHDTLVKEIDPGDSLEPTIPSNQPSLILFIDRSSESSKQRGESNSALQIVRKFVKDSGLSSTPNQIIPRYSQHKTIDHSSPHLDKFKDNMAFMVLNKGEMVSLNAVPGDQGTYIQNVLATLLQQRKSLTEAKETTISLLAKKVGFQLLSEDFKVHIVDSLPSQFKSSHLYIDGDVISDDYSHVSLMSDHVRNQRSGSYCQSNTNSLQSIIAKELEEYRRSFTCPINESFNFEKEYHIKTPTEDSDIKDIYTDDTKEIINSPKTSNSFQGSFFFSDGNFKLLRSLTGGSKIPLLVILDPISQGHYVCEDMDVNYYSLTNFLGSYMNGTLTPYQLSESSVIKPREYPRPPFVNHDFHEADSIPRATMISFCEMIIGYKPCELGNKLPNKKVMNDNLIWKKDVLVLFTTSWCGFCQRMELIVREVHRAIRHFSYFLDDDSDSNAKHFHDYPKDTSRQGLPSVYLMDCTLNDCGTLLKPVSKEVYPKLMLFPAENKTATIYEGDMSVASIFEFLTSSGRNSGYLNRNKGVLWTPWKGSKSYIPMHGKTTQINNIETLALRTKETEDVISITKNIHHRDYHIMPGSILAATEKLINTATFNNATILMVKADTNQGFQGLIINKPISWDIFEQLDPELEALKRTSLFYGGPVNAQEFPLVSLTRKEIEGYLRVFDNLYFGGPVATGLAVGRIKSGDAMAEDFRFFVGYSSWGWEQLFEELEGGAWSVTESNIRNLDLPVI